MDSRGGFCFYGDFSKVVFLINNEILKFKLRLVNLTASSNSYLFDVHDLLEAPAEICLYLLD